MWAQWMGGPNDGEWIQIPDGARSLNVPRIDHSPASYMAADELGPAEPIGWNVQNLPVARFIGAHVNENGVTAIEKMVVVYHE